MSSVNRNFSSIRPTRFPSVSLRNPIHNSWSGILAANWECLSFLAPRETRPDRLNFFFVGDEQPTVWQSITSKRCFYQHRHFLELLFSLCCFFKKYSALICLAWPANRPNPAEPWVWQTNSLAIPDSLGLAEFLFVQRSLHLLQPPSTPGWCQYPGWQH